MEELSRLMDQELRRQWKYFDLPLWRMVVVDDFSAEKSYCIFLFHHGLSDGIQAASCMKIICSENDTQSIRNIRGVKETTFLQKLAIPFLKVCYAIAVGAYLLSRTAAVNPLKKQGIPEKEKRHVYLSDDYDNQAFTRIRRQYEGSFVNTMHAIMGQVYREYMIK